LNHALRKQIFERFYRGENQNIQGSGLGLSISQKMAQLHNAEIQLDDVANGSELCVRMDFWCVGGWDCKFRLAESS